MEKEIRRSAPIAAAGMVQQICGCKWSLTVYWLIGNGVNRPGEMARRVPGLTAKVLNDCLRRNVELGILDRHVFAEVPPRVEYAVTPLGHRFLALLSHLEALQHDIETLDRTQQNAAP
jgi:DNA-binding HxlR family transcriptional regulator